MSARHLSGRRKKYMIGLPKDAAVPKFLKPVEIERARQLSIEYPDVAWDRIIDCVVCSSFPDLETVLIT